MELMEENFGVLLFLLFDLNREGRQGGIGIADGSQGVGVCSHVIKGFSIKTAAVWPANRWRKSPACTLVVHPPSHTSPHITNPHRRLLWGLKKGKNP